MVPSMSMTDGACTSLCANIVMVTELQIRPLTVIINRFDFIDKQDFIIHSFFINLFFFFYVGTKNFYGIATNLPCLVYSVFFIP
jgi:hypothetical protein